MIPHFLTQRVIGGYFASNDDFIGLVLRDVRPSAGKAVLIEWVES